MSPDVLDGASTVAAAAIALFFTRFYQATGDRFFAFFAGAFLIFALDRALIVVLPGDSEIKTAVYLVRAAAFAMIVWAVMDKNRRYVGTPERAQPPPREGDAPVGVPGSRARRDA